MNDTDTTKENEARSTFELLGFNEIQTGGGCTAWHMTLDDRHECIVSSYLDATIDLNLECAVSIVETITGLENEVCSSRVFATAHEFINWITNHSTNNVLPTNQILLKYGIE